MSDATAQVSRRRHAQGRVEIARDEVAREEPLELRVGGASLAVVMRTPGHDRELALGFLVTERVVASADQVVSVRHAQVAPDEASAENVVQVVLAPEVSVDLDRLRRNLYASSSCGICGKATIEDALATAPPLDDPTRVPGTLFAGLTEQLRAQQAGFASTGGLHAAGLFSAEGERLVVREDIGRHNAVDKVVGWAARAERLPLRGCVLLVSGRVSFEVVQKALAARIPIVAAVGAPSSLAIELAERASIGIVGFLRDGGFNVYGHAQRVLG